MVHKNQDRLKGYNLLEIDLPTPALLYCWTIICICIVNTLWLDAVVHNLIPILSSQDLNIISISHLFLTPYKVRFTWKTVSIAIEKESKLDAGVPNSKLNVPPKSCIPSSAKMRMKRKRRSSKETIDFRDANRDTTRLRSDDQ